MASVSFAQNTYAGEVLEDLLTYTAQGNDTYKEGLIHIKSGIQYKYTLPSVSLGDIIQDNKPTPTSPTDSKGTYTGRNVHHHLRCIQTFQMEDQDQSVCMKNHCPAEP